VKQRLIRLLLRWLGVPVPKLPDLPIFVVVIDGQRVADVTTNRNRAIALCRQTDANSQHVRLWRYGAIASEKFSVTGSPGT